MALIGRLHPLLVHFPIALIVIAAGAEAAATLTDDERWRTVAIVNLRAGAAFAVIAAIAGWRLASALGFDGGPLVEWHRWLGLMGATATLVASLAASRLEDSTLLELRAFRAALFLAALLVAVTAHLGGLLVWGADFLRP